MNSRHQVSQLPQVNLVPMIDVLMSVLTFFVILAMSLTGRVIEDVEVPQLSQTALEIAKSALISMADRPQFVVGLTRQGELVFERQRVELDGLVPLMEQFLEEHPHGVVALTGDRQLDYRQVETVLEKMVEIGGDRVFLVISK